MSTEGKRIKEIRKILGFTQKEFAEILGFRESFMSSVENDRNLLNHGKQLLLLQNYDVNINYILAGIGDPFLTKQDKESNNELKKNVQELIEEELKKRGL
ncbi:MAG: helix-turn-helix transcriptional regulator [Candidatus Gastranaerophilaceae bacterium]